MDNKNCDGKAFKMLYPFWRQDTMVNEISVMLEREDGRFTAKLLFKPEEIISVKDWTLEREFKEGTDYTWEPGTNELVLTEGSAIKFFRQKDIEGYREGGERIPPFDGKFDELGRSRFGNALFCVSEFLYGKQIAVTYRYKTDSWEGPVTACQADRIPVTMGKLRNKEKTHVVFYGDSIFTGCDASILYNRPPMQESFVTLVPKALGEYFGGEVTVHNPSVGGTNSQWGVENMEKIFDGGIPDIVILGFGMNGLTGDENAKNLNTIIDFVKSKNPECEFVVTACMVPNANAGFLTTQGQCPDAFGKMAGDGIAFTDMFTFHSKILETKDFIATTGNGINHPNDWLIRCYGMNLMSVFIDF